MTDRDDLIAALRDAFALGAQWGFVYSGAGRERSLAGALSIFDLMAEEGELANREPIARVLDAAEPTMPT